MSKVIMPLPGHALKRNVWDLPFPFPFLTGQDTNMMAGAGTATLEPRDGSHMLRMTDTLPALDCFPLDYCVRANQTSVLFKSQYFGPSDHLDYTPSNIASSHTYTQEPILPCYLYLCFLISNFMFSFSKIKLLASAMSNFSFSKNQLIDLLILVYLEF